MSLTQIEAFSVAMNEEANQKRIKEIQNARVAQASSEGYSEFIESLRNG